ncbi:MAG: hypothetical protein HFH54_08720 [Lachnospiraceae bacterium]|nr:hypothetical protein [Lachnospiraceae bacterium]MCI9389747.1 hypothetical protein [Lachnospiraceae bacterium]
MEVIIMPVNEKELNCNLFDQLTLLEDIEKVANETQNIEKVLEMIAWKRQQVERKLYQQPPLSK